MATLRNPLACVVAPALFALALGSPAAATGEPAAFRPPVPVVRTLPNGLEVAVFPDHRLALVQIQLLIPAGSAQDPERIPGVADATARLLRAGTTSRSAAALAAELEQLGGSISAAASRDFSTVSGSFLSADFEHGLELLSDIVVNPVFPPDEITRHHSQVGGLLVQRRRSPAALAEDRLWAAAFAGHPYGRIPLGTTETLSWMDRATVQEFHRDYYRPDRAVLAIAGDVEPERAFAAAVDRFGDWAGRSVAQPPAAPPGAPASMRILVVDRPGSAQSEVRIGLVCPPRNGPDALPLQLASHVFGGAGMSSRLADALRVEGHLAYDVRSNYTPLRTAGLLSIGTTSRPESVGVFVGRVREALAGLATRPPGEAEVEAARHYLEAGYPLQFQTLGAVITQWMGTVLNDLPADGLARQVGDLRAVTRAQVVEAGRRWLDPARMVVVAVGPAALLKERLEVLGPVEVADVTPPGAAASNPDFDKADPAQVRRGRELLDQTIAKHGGLERLRRIKESAVRGEMIIQLVGNDTPVQMEQLRKDPFRMKFVTRMIGTENGQVLNGSQGWLYSTGGDQSLVTEADADAIAAMRSAFRSDIVHFLLALADPATRVVARGPGRVAGHDVEVLDVLLPPGSAGDRPERHLLYVDPKEHRLLAEDSDEVPGRPGVFDVRRIYREHRLVDGVLWPVSEERLRSGTRTMLITVNEVLLNSGLSDASFNEPRFTQKPRVR